MFRSAVSLVLLLLAAAAPAQPLDASRAPAGQPVAPAVAASAQRGGRPALRPYLHAEGVWRAGAELGHRAGRSRRDLRRQQLGRARVRRRVVAIDQDAEQHDGAFAGERRPGTDLRRGGRRIRLPVARRHGGDAIRLLARAGACGESRVRRRVAHAGHAGGRLFPVAAVSLQMVRRAGFVSGSRRRASIARPSRQARCTSANPRPDCSGWSATRWRNSRAGGSSPTKAAWWSCPMTRAESSSARAPTACSSPTASR